MYLPALQAVASASATVLANLLRVKIFAVELGPAGVGLLAQLLLFQTTVALVSLLGLPTGVVKLLSEAGRSDRAGRLVGAVVVVVVTAAGLLVILSALGARWLSAGLLDAPQYAGYVVWAAVGGLGLALFQLHQAVLNGLQATGRYARATVAAGTVSVVVTVVFTHLWGMPGAVASLPVSAWAGAAITAGLCYGSGSGRIVPIPPWRGREPGALRPLLAYGVASVALVIMDQMTGLALRGRLISALGVAGNGLYFAAAGFSSQALTTALAFLPIHVFPRVSATGDRGVIATETNRAIHLTLLFGLPVACLILIYKKPLVGLLLSPEFHGALPLFPTQVAGEMLRGLGMAVLVGVLSVAPKLTWVGLGWCFAGVFLACGVLGLPGLGLQAMPVAYLAAASVFAVAGYGVMRARAGLVLTAGNRRLLATGTLLFLIVLAWFSNDRPISLVLGPVVVAAWSRVSLTREEWEGLRAAARTRMGIS